MYFIFCHPVVHEITVAHKCTPNSKRHSQFFNFTPNSKTSLRIPKPHSEFQNLTPNSKISLRILESHSEFQNLTLNSKISLRIPKSHSEFQKLNPNSKTSLRILKAVSVKRRLRTRGKMQSEGKLYSRRGLKQKPANMPTLTSHLLLQIPSFNVYETLSPSSPFPRDLTLQFMMRRL